MDASSDPFAANELEASLEAPLEANEAHSSSNLALNDLEPPRASYLASSELESTRHSYVQTPSNSGPLLPVAGKAEATDDVDLHDTTATPPSKQRRRLLLLIPAVFLIIIVLAVVIPVYFTVVKHHRNNNAATSGFPSTGPSATPTSGPKAPSTAATTGGDGSTVTQEDGSTFTYRNPFGGFWVDDPNNPFNDNAQPNSWTPPLNTSWQWGVDHVYGVNIGGWFVIEPFISPALFQKYPGAVDEWSLSEMMAADTASGGLNQLEDHYNTFITEEDFAQIAGAGLNWIRLAIPFWAIDVWPGEPFLAQVSWKYIVRCFGWARKYGIRVNLDLHTCPGSQNGFNHSGKDGKINFLNGVMGIANAQRMMNYIRIITEFISQPEYRNVVPVFSIINEPLYSTIGKDPLGSFYKEAHDVIRSITGLGAGNGPYIAIHDGFQGPANWAGFLPGADRMILDTHPYFAFDGSASTAPIVPNGGVWASDACSRWGSEVNTSQTAFGVTIAGEFSTGFNDCGLFLLGADTTQATDVDCTAWSDASTFSPETNAGLMQFTLASMDSLQNWFFWTWKIGNSSTSGTVQSPLWSYKLGLQVGYIPTDPRQSVGTCAALGDSADPFDGTYASWQTGGAGAGTIAATAVAEFGQWPPISIAGEADAALLPTYTPTGTVVTLAPPSLTVTPPGVTVGNGWFDASDTAGAPTPIAGCTYPNAWDALNAAVPAGCH